MTKRMIIIIIAMAVQITTAQFLMPQPLSMTLTQGLLRVECTKTYVLVCRHVYYNSIIRVTSVRSRHTGINIVQCLVLITYGTEISYQYRIFINIPVCHVVRPALTKSRKQLPMRTHLGLASLPLALLKHKTDMLAIYCYGRKLQSISSFAGVQSDKNVTDP